MVKHRIGIAKMKAAKERRLERGRAKMERKRKRHRNCHAFFTTGKHDVLPDLDGSLYCDYCLRPTMELF